MNSETTTKKAVSFTDDDAAQASALQMMEEYIIDMKVDDDTTEDDGVNDRTPSTCNKLETDSEAQSRKCPRGVLIVTISCLAIAVIISCLFIFGVVSNNDLDGVPVLGNIDFDGFFDTDPFGGAISPLNPEEAYRWGRPGNGLELFVLNALDDSWQTTFENSLQDWENGTPDALTLTTRRVAYDFECEPETGIMKVCNGDYGATLWKGLNTVFLDQRERWILASAAQMNEYYLKRASRAQKTYTMCHELGHGFGLPHWDEDFFNRNIGNCMDYTNSPRTNARPDQSNFDFLTALYGEVGSTLPPSDLPNNGINGDRGTGGNGRQLQDASEANRGYQDQPPREIPRAVLEAFRSAMKEFNVPGENKWTLLHSSGNGEAHERQLGDDFTVRVFMLRA
jgi:hypothetical protein